MRLLIDTNVLIALEPVALADRERGLPNAAQLSRLAAQQGHLLCVHPETLTDLARDGDDVRAGLRDELLGKYVSLKSPPPVTSHMEAVLSPAELGSNDWVDHMLLAAVLGDAVDYLVTEDRGVHAKARRLSIEDRVHTVNEAVSALRDLYDTTPDTLPHVRAIECHELSTEDPIWQSFRDEYEGFDGWLSSCKRQGRKGWVIDAQDRYAGIAIIKADQDPGEYGLIGRTLKLCSLKVCDDFNGQRYGELLLRSVFDYAFENGYENVVVTVFPHHWLLINLLESFGFSLHGTNVKKEEIRTKRLRPRDDEVAELDALEFHIRFGPQAARLIPNQAFVVPIKPMFHRRLFPELDMAPLTGCQPCGNSMRKAYLSHSAITSVKPGALLLFYRSGDAQAVDVVGVVEDTLRTGSAQEIARYVGKRTVFDFSSIEGFCGQGETLVLLFRQVVTLRESEKLSLERLVANGVLKDAPQTVQSISGGEEWLAAQLKRLY